MASKAENQRQHALWRARSRYGLNLNRAQYQALCLQIQTGKAQFIGRQTNRVSVWRIQLEDKRLCNVIYDKVRHQIATFLPPGIHSAKGVALGLTNVG